MNTVYREECCYWSPPLALYRHKVLWCSRQISDNVYNLVPIGDRMQMHDRGLLWENDIRRRDDDNCHRKMVRGLPSHHSDEIVDIATDREDMNIQITMRTMRQPGACWLWPGIWWSWSWSVPGVSHLISPPANFPTRTRTLHGAPAHYNQHRQQPGTRYCAQ